MTDPDKLLAELNLRAAKYAEKATQVSNLLQRAEYVFQEMPGKLQVLVGDADDDGELSFQREEGKWRLTFVTREEGGLSHYVVTESPVEIKARAAKLLPELFNTLLDLQKERQDLLDNALEALKEIPFLDVPTSGNNEEGK